MVSSESARYEGGERRGEIRIVSANLVNYYEVMREGDLSEEQFYAMLGTAQTLDISASGCRLRVREPLPLGAELNFDLQLADHIVSLHGTIVRVIEVEDGWEAGIRFSELDDLAKDGIRLYLSFQAEEEGGS